MTKLLPQITNVTLVHIEPMHTGSIRKIGGTVVKVEFEIGIDINFQLEKSLTGETVFYEPNWNVASEDLQDAIAQVIAIEEDYQQYCEKEELESIAISKGTTIGISDQDDLIEIGNEIPF